MHWLRLVLFSIVPLILAVAAPVLLLWAWGNGLPLLPALLVGLLFLSAAVVVHLAGMLHQQPDAQAVDALWVELTQLRDQVRRLSQDLPAMHPEATRQQQRDDAQGAPREQATEAKAAERTEGTFDEQQELSRASPAQSDASGRDTGGPPSDELPAGAASSDEETPGEATANMPAASAAYAVRTAKRTSAETNTEGPAQMARPDTAHAATPRADVTPTRLLPAPQGYALYMESVHETADGKTVLYRAMPALPAENGRIYPGRHAQLQARLLGQAGALQLHTLRDSLGFLRELRSMQGELPVACPLDAATLAHGPTAEAVLQTVRVAGALARDGLLLVVEMDDLDPISREAHAGLVALADHVAGWVLDCGHLPQADVALPLPLRVRHVDVPVAGLELMTGLSDGMERLRALAARGWRTVARDVQTETQLALVRQLDVLARGSLLASPRRLRLAAGDATVEGATGAAMSGGNGVDVMPRRVAGMG